MKYLENEEFYKQYPEINTIFRYVKLKEALDEVTKWKQEGKTKEEVLSIINRQVLDDNDVEKIYQEVPNRGMEELEIIKNDVEIQLFLDNFRREIKPTERAKTYKLKIQTLKQIGLSYKEARDKIAKDYHTSSGNIQRHLRFNYLIQELQNILDSHKISLKSAESLSFLDKEEQSIVYQLIVNENIKISDIQAQKIKKFYQEENHKITKDKLKELLNLN